MTAPAWRSRPVPRGLAVVAAALILLAPPALWVDPFDGYVPLREGFGGLADRLALVFEPFSGAFLFADDFGYVAGSRTPADLSRSWLLPHNTHVVPLFRAWTFAWVRAAGSLARLPETLALASSLTYAAAMLLVGRLAARETGRVEVGLAAMAGYGISAVLRPTVAWYAAGQAVFASVGVLATLAALQRWRTRGGVAWLAASALFASASPLLWSAGVVAGPSGFVYLWADGRPNARRAAFVPLLASGLTALAVLGMAGSRVSSPANFHGRPVAEAVRPVQGALSTAQGVVEILVLKNLGLASGTTPEQALAFLVALALAWGGSRGGSFRPGPLEAAGLTAAGLGFFLAYSARGYFTFDNLRDLSWYAAIPQAGAALFAAGWWGARPASTPPERLQGPTRGGLLAVAGVVVLAVLLQQPRVRAQNGSAPHPPTASERRTFRTPRLLRIRARALNDDRADWQRRALGRLDRVEAAALRASADRGAVRAVLGRPRLPGMPPEVAGLDAVQLLALPETGARVDAARLRSALNTVWFEEPEPRPIWLPPGEVWPPAP